MFSNHKETVQAECMLKDLLSVYSQEAMDSRGLDFSNLHQGSGSGSGRLPGLAGSLFISVIRQMLHAGKVQTTMEIWPSVQGY